MIIKHFYKTSLILFCCLFIWSCKGNLIVKWWCSVPNKLFEEQRNLLLQKADSTFKIDAELFTDSMQQEIDGFGGCFNELGWKALSLLDENKRNNIMNNLFDPEKGVKFNICRMPIGASDYASNYYSLDDSTNDYSLDYFSIDRDKSCLIPYIKAALHCQKHLKIWASPWTPPAWMKTNNHYACATSKNNGLEQELQGKEGTNQIRLNDTVLHAYAKYLAKFVKSYEEQDIPIYAIHVQNEFNSCQVFPSCTWTAYALKKFIGGFLGPQFEKSRVDAEIWLGTIDRPSFENIDTILSDKQCIEYIQGLGFQWGGKGAIDSVHLKYPALRLMQTESECGDGSNDWKAAENTFRLMKHYFNAGANSYMYWNMILDETGKSSWGWKQNSLISINKKTNEVTYNPEFYLFRHVSGFVPSGSHKILIKGKFSDILAFITPKNDLIIITVNFSKIPKLLRLKVGNKVIETVLPRSSVNTFLYYSAV